MTIHSTELELMGSTEPSCEFQPHSSPPKDALQILHLSDLESPLDYEKLFGRQAPVEIEIGAGRGDFLVQYAAANPHLNLLGIERKIVYLRRGLNKARVKKLKNVALIGTEARYLVQNYIPDSSVRAVHLYFPDPWPKTCHAKRRMFSNPVIAELKRILQPGGTLYLRTDVESYFKTMVELMSYQEQFTRVADNPDVLKHQTGFESRFRRANLPIYIATYKLNNDRV